MNYKKKIDIQSLIQNFLREEGLEIPLMEYRIIQAWPEVVGEKIAQYTKELYIKNNTLQIRVTSPALRQNLSMNQKVLTAKLNAHVNYQVITGIRFY